MSLDETGRVLAALAHPVRRKIIMHLGMHKTASYSELMRELGVESSLLSFHLKKLGDFIEKENGLYRLSLLGIRAYKILHCIEYNEEKLEGLFIRKDFILILDDNLLLEAFKLGGLAVEASLIYVTIDVSRSLYKKTVKKANGLVIYVPRDLYGYTVKISKAKLIIPYSKKPFNPSKPVEIIKDLERRGYPKIALELRKRLGYQV